MDVRQPLRLQETGRRGAAGRRHRHRGGDRRVREADVLWLESPTNPLLGVADLPRLCAFARERGILCVVDNTLATPLLQRPLALGADVVVHSATKAMGGHSDLLLGAAVVADATRTATRCTRHAHSAARRPARSRPTCACAGCARCRCASSAHRRNATVLAQRLSEHPDVHEVRYPGLASHPQHERAATTGRPRLHAHLPRPRGRRPRRRARRPPRVLTHATSLGGVETTLERRARYPADAPSSRTTCCASASDASTSRTSGTTSSRHSQPPESTADAAPSVALKGRSRGPDVSAGATAASRSNTRSRQLLLIVQRNSRHR